MGGTTLVAICLAAAALAAVVVLAVLLVRERRHTAALLDAGRAESAELRRRLDGLSAEAPARRETAAFVITDVAESAPGQPSGPRPGPTGQLVLSAAVTESLVRTLALTHGLRRALAPRTRHHILFEMRHETRRARKQRKQEMREAWRRERRARTGSHAA